MADEGWVLSATIKFPGTGTPVLLSTGIAQLCCPDGSILLNTAVGEGLGQPHTTTTHALFTVGGKAQGREDIFSFTKTPHGRWWGKDLLSFSHALRASLPIPCKQNQLYYDSRENLGEVKPSRVLQLLWVSASYPKCYSQ